MALILLLILLLRRAPLDTIPISQFEHRVAKWAARLRKQRKPLHVTQRGRASLVVLTKEQFDELQADRQRAQALEIRMLIAAGERDIAAGRVYTQKQVEKRLRALDRREKRAS